jgi:hypothetical protein
VPAGDILIMILSNYMQIIETLSEKFRLRFEFNLLF